MVGVGKHVDGAHGAHDVAGIHELAHVAGLGGGVAGNVHDALGGEGAGGGEERGRRAGPGRIHEEHERTGTLPRRGELFHERRGVLGDERGVFHAVVAGVARGIADGRFHRINADDAGSSPLGGHQADGARAAVGIDHRLRPREPGQADGLVVEHLGLRGVHLVERLRRDAEAETAQRIQNEPRAVEHALLLAEDHIGGPRVHVLHDGGDLGHAAHEFAAEGLRRGELVAVGDHRDQHLARLVAHPHHGVTHEAGAGVLIVGLHAPAGHDVADGQGDALGRFVLDGTGIGGNEAMAARCVHAREDVVAGQPGIAALPLAAGSPRFPLGGRIGRDDLVAVVEGLFHADNRQHRIGRSKALEERGHALLLGRQLRLVGHIELTAAAAAAKHGAERAGAGGGAASRWASLLAPLCIAVHHCAAAIDPPLCPRGLPYLGGAVTGAFRLVVMFSRHSLILT